LQNKLISPLKIKPFVFFLLIPPTFSPHLWLVLSVNVCFDSVFNDNSTTFCRTTNCMICLIFYLQILGSKYHQMCTGKFKLKCTLSERKLKMVRMKNCALSGP
jgi:hypothetical protein